ncbi:DNA internalization-related competence protein ComEC/Rec2 [Nevskia sp.]|uniref:DNA internalization-related competence protein ComEC/Rec2 n=1 Tax=Nevskia sp. TaxID=1929292 RepID=UPI0025F18827|nr:DNA internalization-related competence protein ComEC/Rec2 [Nevskia sp.]
MPLVVAFTLGALALLQSRDFPLLWVYGVLLIASLLMRRWRSLLLAFTAGAVITAFEAGRVIDSRWPSSRFGEVITVEGVVASLPQAQRGEAGFDGEARDGVPSTTWRFRFDPVDKALPSKKIRVAWYRSSESLRGGECWRLRLVMRTPHGGINPGGFDYEGWLFRQGIGATATVRGGERCEDTGSHRLLRLRQAFSDRLKAWLPDHPALPMVAALTLGDTSGLDEDDWQAFRLTGTTHLVAISGFNVAIVAGVVFWLLRAFWRLVPALCLRVPAPRAALAASVLAAFLYALLAGFEPPVQRAALMLGLLALAGAWGGLGQPSRALALAWGLIVATDPLTLLAPGLWLSFAAVGAIFYVSAGRLGPVSGWRAAIRVQLMLSLMLAPLTLYWFQGTSLTGPLVNLAAVPIAALLTPALIGALLLTALVPVIGLPLLTGVADALALGQQALLWIADATPKAWAAASPEPAALLLALIGAVALFAPAGLPLRVFGVIALSALFLPPPRVVEEGFRATVLDVGQGLAVVVHTARHTLLYDAGPAYPGGFDAGRSVVVPYLLRSGARKLDRLIVSHGDLDHVGGVTAVKAALRVDQRSGSGSDQPCMAGERWTWDGVGFELLAGPEAGLSDNDGSCVLRVSYGGQALLLAGDIEAQGEARLLATAPDKLEAKVLVTPHHGSRTSSSAAFIDAIQPELTIHSAGWHHRFRHPAREVVARYAERGVKQIATGDSGAVTVDFDMNGRRTNMERRRAKRLWSTPADHVWHNHIPDRYETAR